MCDWIFLAADGHAARHWVNAIAGQYLIPATQAGVKIPVNTETGDVGQIHAITRRILPGEGCMWCNGLIDPAELAIDMHPGQEREAARYVDEAPAPSVIALNTLAAAKPSTSSCLPPPAFISTTTTSPGSSTARAPGNETS